MSYSMEPQIQTMDDSPAGQSQVPVRGPDVSEMERLVRWQSAELERTQKEVQQFVYILSHDLQEPLRMVTSYCELLQRRYEPQLDAPGQEFIRYAIEGARQMGAKIQGLQEYSRIVSRAAPYSMVDLTDVMLEVQINLSSAVRATNGCIHQGELPLVYGDRSQLVLAFQHLLDNALKFVSKGHTPTIRVSGYQAGSAWEILFEDNGIGIDPRHSDDIFSIFRQLHGRDSYSGIGLGLALCKRIFEGHGGSIRLGEADTGSRFIIRLPIP